MYTPSISLRGSFLVILGNNLILVFMVYQPSPAMNASTGNQSGSRHVGGNVLLASIFPKPKSPFKKPVVITIEHTRGVREIIKLHHHYLYHDQRYQINIIITTNIITTNINTNIMTMIILLLSSLSPYW